MSQLSVKASDIKAAGGLEKFAARLQRAAEAEKMPRVLSPEPAKKAAAVPSEHDEQAALFQLAALEQAKLPDLDMLFAIPNGGARHKGVAGKLKAEGVKRGVPDVCLPVARCGYHGLYVEMKRQAGGELSPAQREWIRRLRANGYAVAVAHGVDQAWECIRAYLLGEMPEREVNDGQ